MARELMPAGVAERVGQSRIGMRDHWAIDFALGNCASGAVIRRICGGAQDCANGTVSMGPASDVFGLGIYLPGRRVGEFFGCLFFADEHARGLVALSGAIGGIAIGRAQR